jgi:hypothetical protein
LFITGGCNNNPTAMQFGYALRRFVAHATSVISIHGNVNAPLELPSQTTNVISPISLPLKISATVLKAQSQSQILTLELTPLSEFSKGVVTYIAGSIMRRLGESIACKDCRNAVFSSHPNTTQNTLLIELRDCGGLFFPSKDLNDICELCESIFRHSTKPLQTKVTVFENTLIHHLGDKMNSIFSKGSVHFNVAKDHLLSLIRNISRRFFILRKFHAVRLINDSHFHTRTRFLSSKNIIFRGE